MSQIEHHRGIATKINIPSNLSINEYAKLVLKENNKEDFLDYYSNAIECLCGEFNEQYYYHVVTSTLYKLDNVETNDPDEDITNASINNDGTISYEIKYYNGGACFNEVIEEAFNSLDIDQLESNYKNPKVQLLTEFTDWLRDCGEDAFYVFENTEEAINNFFNQNNK